MAELESQRTALTTERDGLESQRNAIVEERRQWEACQEEMQRGIDEQREHLAARATELESQQNALAAERDSVQISAERCLPKNAGNGRPSRRSFAKAPTTNTSKRLLGWRETSVAAKCPDSRARHTGGPADASAEQRRQWQDQQNETSRPSTRIASNWPLDRLNWSRGKARWEARTRWFGNPTQRVLAEDRRKWQVQQKETHAVADEQREHLAARLAELESQWKLLAEERRQWQTQQEEAQRQADEQRKQLAARLAELESQQDALTEERRQWQARQETRQSPDERHEQMEAQLAGLEAQRSALAAERSSLETQRMRWPKNAGYGSSASGFFPGEQPTATTGLCHASAVRGTGSRVDVDARIARIARIAIPGADAEGPGRSERGAPPHRRQVGSV